MLGRSQFAAVKEDVDGLTVPTLVNSLKSAIQNAEALVSREEKLKTEIEGKKREIQLLQENLSEKSRSEKEVRELASRLMEERDGLSARLKENEAVKKENIELKRKICDLECAKLRLETDVDVYRSRFKESEGRVLNLEKDYEMLSKAENSREPVDMEIENDGFGNLPTETTNAGERKVSEEFVKSEELSEKNANPTGGSSHRKRTGMNAADALGRILPTQKKEPRPNPEELPSDAKEPTRGPGASKAQKRKRAAPAGPEPAAHSGSGATPASSGPSPLPCVLPQHWLQGRGGQEVRIKDSAVQSELRSGFVLPVDKNEYGRLGDNEAASMCLMELSSGLSRAVELVGRLSKTSQLEKKLKETLQALEAEKSKACEQIEEINNLKKQLGDEKATQKQMDVLKKQLEDEKMAHKQSIEKCEATLLDSTDKLVLLGMMYGQRVLYACQAIHPDLVLDLDSVDFPRYDELPADSPALDEDNVVSPVGAREPVDVGSSVPGASAPD